MQKCRLIELLLNYELQAWSYNVRILLLQQFLQTSNIKKRGANDDISPLEFINYIQFLQYNPRDLFSYDYFNGNSSSACLFREFIFEDREKITLVKAKSTASCTTLFNRLPHELRHYLYSFFNERSLANLALTSTFFNQDIKAQMIWFNRLISKTRQRELLESVRRNIRDYKNLYINCKRFGILDRYETRADWQLLCLSGEINAIKHLLTDPLLLTYQDKDLRTPLHYAAFAGTVNGMRLLIEQGLNFAARSKIGTNTLHFAALGGKRVAMQFAIYLGIDPMQTNLWGSNVLHFAAHSGNAKAMRYVVNQLKIDVKSEGVDHASVLDYAVSSGNPNAIQFVIDELHMTHPKARHDGANAVHHAALSGNPRSIEFAINKLGLLPHRHDKYFRNVLHYASLSGNPAAMCFAAKIYGITSNSQDKFGLNALHYAAMSGSIEAVAFAVKVLGIDPKSTDNDGENILHHAACENPYLMCYIVEELHIDVNSKDKAGRTVLYHAASVNEIYCFEYAIKLCKNTLENEDNDGDNIFAFIIDECDMPIESIERFIACLLGSGFNTCHKDSQGRDAFNILNTSDMEPDKKLRITTLLNEYTNRELVLRPRPR